MDKFADLRMQANLLRVDIRAARTFLRRHEQHAQRLRLALRQCEVALTAVHAALRLCSS